MRELPTRNAWSVSPSDAGSHAAGHLLGEGGPGPAAAAAAGSMSEVDQEAGHRKEAAASMRRCLLAPLLANQRQASGRRQPHWLMPATRKPKCSSYFDVFREFAAPAFVVSQNS